MEYDSIFNSKSVKFVSRDNIVCWGICIKKTWTGKYIIKVFGVDGFREKISKEQVLDIIPFKRGF